MGPRPSREVKIFFFLRYDYQSINEDNLMSVASQPRTKVSVQALTRKKATKAGYNVLSLIVFADNINAQRLYWRCGFKMVENVELESHEFIPHQGGCLLIKCKV